MGFGSSSIAPIQNGKVVRLNSTDGSDAFRVKDQDGATIFIAKSNGDYGGRGKLIKPTD